jgi:hypothetical protein
VSINFVFLPMMAGPETVDRIISAPFSITTRPINFDSESIVPSFDASRVSRTALLHSYMSSNLPVSFQ